MVNMQQLSAMLIVTMSSPARPDLQKLQAEKAMQLHDESLFHGAGNETHDTNSTAGIGQVLSFVEESEVSNVSTVSGVRITWPDDWTGPGKLDTEATYVGMGSFGKVYLARVKCNKRWVAVKALVLNSREAQLESRQESELLKHLTINRASPRFTTLFKYGEIVSRKRAFIMMEAALGGDFRKVTDPRRGAREVPLLTKQRLFFEMVQGIEAMHRDHIVHRDLKPANVMLSLDCRGKASPCKAKVGDLGMACSSSSFTVLPDLEVCSPSVQGTPLYMAPETWRGKSPARPAVDMWACGLIFYEMLFGTLPAYTFVASQSALARKTQEYNVNTDERVTSHPDATVRALLTGMLAQDRGARMTASTVLSLAPDWFADAADDSLPRLSCWGPKPKPKPRPAPKKEEAAPRQDKPPRVEDEDLEEDVLGEAADAAEVELLESQEMSYAANIIPDSDEFTIWKPFTNIKTQFMFSKWNQMVDGRGKVIAKQVDIDKHVAAKRWPRQLKEGDRIVEVNDVPFAQVQAGYNPVNGFDDGFRRILQFGQAVGPRKQALDAVVLRVKYIRG